jgi:hypothetical protein
MTGIEHKTLVEVAGEHVEPANPDDIASTPGRPDTGGKSALASRFESISSKAVEKLDEIMGLPLDPDHPAFAPVLRAQTTHGRRPRRVEQAGRLHDHACLRY